MAEALMVCSGGGHLKQLFTLSERLGVDPDDQVWITFENGLSTSLLADRKVYFAPFVAPRELRSLWRFRRVVTDVIRRHSFDRAFSTGSSPAVATLPMAAAAGARASYIESAARADGPSVSGRILAQFPSVRTFTQYPGWATKRWQFRGSIYDSYSPVEPTRTEKTPRRAVVTVGTQEGYGFDRLFSALVPLLADFDDVLWQTGPQDVSRWGIPGRVTVPHDELRSAMQEADVVIAHSGTGSALSAFEAGKAPILVPRLKAHGEHVDDHQVQIAAEMDRRGLAIMSSPEAITSATLARAASMGVTSIDAPPMHLDDDHEDGRTDVTRLLGQRERAAAENAKAADR